MGRAVLVMALFAFGGIAAPAFAQESTITKLEVRNDPPAETHERLRDVVWGVFELEDRRRDEPPQRQLDDVWLRTRPHATDTVGLCRYDQLRVNFQRADPEVGGPAAEMRPVSVNSTSYWSFRMPPRFDADLYAEDPQPAQMCAGDPASTHYFRAADDREATEGYLAWMGLRRDLTEGREVDLQCSLSRMDAGNCKEVILSLDPTALSSVEPCNAGPYPGSCYGLFVGDRQITVEFDSHLSSENPRAMRVRLASPIILLHERID